MKNIYQSASSLAIAALLSVTLSGCHDEPMTTKDESHHSEASSDTLPLEKIFAKHNDTEMDHLLKAGVDMLLEGNYQGASKRFNTALLENPSSSWVHYLNGLSYHLMAQSGDKVQTDLAIAGYQQALKFDPLNTLASLQLGRLRADQKRYIDAQEEFANVLLIKPDNFDALYELAAVSYKAGDMKTARMAIDRADRVHGTKPEVIKAKAMILAASGKGEEAMSALAAYQKESQTPLKAKKLESRLSDWRKLYDRGIILAQANPDEQFETDSAAPDTTVGPEADGGDEQVADVGAAVPAEMIILDAIVMSVTELGETSKGSNILDNFTLTLAPGTHFKGKSQNGSNTASSFPIFPITTAVPTVPGGTHDTTGAASETTKVFTQGVSFGSVTYSLRIANAVRNHVEVVGRPSLVASVGKSAKFFSGRELALGLTGEYGGTITKIPVGVTLDVTPLSYDGENVILDITLYGSLIANEQNLQNNNATERFTDINISKVQTTIKAKLGETVMLAGITEREDTDGKSGFPILQDIPIVQYAFSNESTTSRRRSVMYLITPRAYDDNKQAVKSITDFKDSRVNLTELELRNKDWYQPDYNMAVTMKHLAPLYREFRHGDLDELKWYMRDSVKTSAQQAVSFFYY